MFPSSGNAWRTHTHAARHRKAQRAVTPLHLTESTGRGRACAQTSVEPRHSRMKKGNGKRRKEQKRKQQSRHKGEDTWRERETRREEETQTILTSTARRGSGGGPSTANGTREMKHKQTNKGPKNKKEQCAGWTTVATTRFDPLATRATRGEEQGAEAAKHAHINIHNPMRVLSTTRPVEKNAKKERHATHTMAGTPGPSFKERGNLQYTQTHTHITQRRRGGEAPLKAEEAKIRSRNGDGREGGKRGGRKKGAPRRSSVCALLRVAVRTTTSSYFTTTARQCHRSPKGAAGKQKKKREAQQHRRSGVQLRG